MNSTFDNKRQIKPLRLEDVDKAMFYWFEKKLNLQITKDDGTKRKVPVQFVAPERWSIARQEGIRDENGTIVLPIVAISRTRIGGPNESGYQRIVADTKKDFVYSQQLNKKSSLIKELVKNQGKENREGWTVDPSLPIYEIFTSRVPDHMAIQYEVSIWTQYISEMNEVIEKVGQEYDYLSVKSFKFETEDNFYFVAFQDEELTDDSNTEEYTDNERIIRRNFIYSVPAYIMPEVNNKTSPYKRYLSQTKLVFKEETGLSKEEFEEL